MLSKLKKFTEAQRKRFEAILSLGTHESIVLSQLIEHGSTTVRDLLPFINYPCGPIRDLQRTFGIPITYEWEEKEKTIVQNGKTNVFCIPNIIGKKFHPTEKPVELMKEFISQSTKEGDIVLEPFCGSGATVLAAKQLNRHFVASELDEEYCQITNDRLKGTAQRNQQIENDKQQIKLF